LLCPGQASPQTGQTSCVTEVATNRSDYFVYIGIVTVFAIISLGSIVLFIMLLRSRHAFSIRPFHSGICVYIALFSPYAFMKAVAVGFLTSASKEQQQLTAGIFLNCSFTMFFWLGFGGKMALIQLWMHLISRHTDDQNTHGLQANAIRTWHILRRTVLTVCLLYAGGFAILLIYFFRASFECSQSAHDSACIPATSGSSPASCRDVVMLADGITYTPAPLTHLLLYCIKS
jgi:hypothetical protein